jgi:hypothetical protein
MISFNNLRRIWLGVCTVALSLACATPEATRLEDPPDDEPDPPAQPKPAERVNVTPASFTVMTGDTIRFTAQALDEDDVPVATTFAWNASAGTITSVGLFTAAGPGEARVWAAAGQLADTSAGTVSSLPAQAVDTVFFEGFESNTFSVWDDQGRAENQSIVTNEAHSGARSIRFSFPLNGEGGWLTKFFMPGYDSLHVSMWVKLQAGWAGDTKLVSFTGSRTDNQWSAIGTAGDCPTGTDFFVSALTMDGPATRFYTYHPAMPREGDNVTCWGSSGASGAEGADYFEPTALGAGTWHKVELWVRLNTPGQSNGVMRYWVDGTLRGEWTNISLRTSSILRLNGATVTASRGDGPAQSMWVDDVLVTRQRPGGP